MPDVGFADDCCGKNRIPLVWVSGICGSRIAEAVQVVEEARGRGAKKSRRQGERICGVDEAIDIRLQQVDGECGKRIPTFRTVGRRDSSFYGGSHDHPESIEGGLNVVAVWISNFLRLKHAVIILSKDNVAESILRFLQQHIVGVVSQPRVLTERVAVRLWQVKIPGSKRGVLNKRIGRA